jgi:hypothetical protein
MALGEGVHLECGRKGRKGDVCGGGGGGLVVRVVGGSAFLCCGPSRAQLCRRWMR